MPAMRVLIVKRRTIGYAFVVTVVSLLVSIAVPLHRKCLVRTKESLLKQNLFALRTVLHEYSFDKGKPLRTLQDLVADGYIRKIPADPFTGTDQTWTLTTGTRPLLNQEPGTDVHSGSEQKSL